MEKLSASIKRLDQLLALANRRAVSDQITQTDIPFLRIIHRSNPTPIVPGIIRPSLCLILSGTKKIQIGGKTTRYGPGDFLVSTVSMPVSGNISSATKLSPYVGVALDFDPKEIIAIFLEAKIKFVEEPGLTAAAFVSSSDPALTDSIYRLLKLVNRPSKNEFIASTIKREIIFHLLNGPDGPRFYQNMVERNRDIGVERAISWIQKNYAQPLQVESLARLANMSVSSLHHKFKMITTVGPLQYQKRLRLQEARQLLLAGETDAGGAASKVGYQSQSQFSREYGRLFGAPPIKDMKRLKIGKRGHLQE